MMPKIAAKINPDRAYFPLKVVQSPISRHGVIADADIPARKYVIEYTGVLYNRAQAKKLYAKQPEYKLIYIWNIGHNAHWIIDGLTNGSGAELINHSCDPNLRVKFHGRRVFYIARRPIKKGEELTIDYCFDWDPGNNTRCTCGSVKCRGTINFPPKEYAKAQRELERTRELTKKVLKTFGLGG